jgi:hypothetical protein
VYVDVMYLQASKEWRVVTDYLERLSRHETDVAQSTATASMGLVEIDEGQCFVCFHCRQT